MTDTAQHTTHCEYKAIALDLDGTLTNNDKKVTPHTLVALTKAQQHGIHIILASGRPTYGIEPVAQCLNLDNGGYVLAYNGGKIINWHTKEEIYSDSLPHEVIPEIYQYAKSKGYALLGYRGHEIITERPDDKYVHEESRINKMGITRVECLTSSLDPNPTKLLMTGTPDNMAAAEKELCGIMNGRIDVFRSAPFFIELVPKGIDKAKSLERLLPMIGVRPAELMAFGDGYNDLSMLRLAGMGVAMDNAVEELKQEADFVTLSNENDGVAYAINKILGY